MQDLKNSKSTSMNARVELPAESELNHILPWGQDAVSSGQITADIDILTYEQYKESNVRKQGHRQGMAQRAPTNKQHSQSAYVASAVAELVANTAFGGTSTLVDDREKPVIELANDLFNKIKKVADVAAEENTNLVHITGTETITGEKTFSIPPKVPSKPKEDNDTSNKAYVDEKVKGVADKLLDFNDIYPVGSIYLSLSEAFNPNVAFNRDWMKTKSTWAKIDGKFLLGSNKTYTLNSSGGSATASLAVNNLPSHTHTGTTKTAGSHTHTGTTDTDGSHSHNAGTLGSTMTGFVRGIVEEMYSGPSDVTGVFSSTGSPNSIGWDFAAYNNSLIFNGGGRIGGSTATAGSHSHDLNISTASSHTHSFTTDATGNNQSFSIMPPYLAVNMWQRIS